MGVSKRIPQITGHDLGTEPEWCSGRARRLGSLSPDIRRCHRGNLAKPKDEIRITRDRCSSSSASFDDEAGNGDEAINAEGNLKSSTLVRKSVATFRRKTASLIVVMLYRQTMEWMHSVA